jgi:hypothetical protein
MDLNILHSKIKAALPSDAQSSKGIELAASEPKSCWTVDTDGLLHYDNCIWVSNSETLYLDILRNCHNHVLASYFGYNRTLKLACCNYTWPNIHTFVQDYCNSCITCKQNKALQHCPYGLLKPLPVPDYLWHSISMDFIQQLLPSNNYTVILVVVDRASKQAVFIPTDDNVTSEQVAKLFLIHVFLKHGVPSHVTSDHKTEFVAQFFCPLAELLNITLYFTSGYHPEADSQTECANQTLK